MKREDITRIFPQATDEQITGIMAINGSDIQREQDKAKAGSAKLQSDLDAANAALTKANETIKGLEATKGDTAKLQEEIDRYKRADEERKAAEQKAAAQRELEERFTAVSGDKKYIHDLVRKGVMEDFGRALTDKANRGKSDAEVFEALTKDKGYFASQNPPAGAGGNGNMPPFGAHLGAESDTDKMSDADYYATVFKNANNDK